MATQQDILRTMMTQLDEDSDKIPEGLYLKFCDHLKNLHTCQPAQVALQRSSGPRRCGRCRQVGHDRRNCPQVARDYVEEANRIRSSSTLTRASESLVEVLERKPVIRINDREWRCRPSRNPPRCSIVVEVDLPGVDNIRDIQLSYTAPFPGARDVLHIRVPGKYKADIRLPGRKNCGSTGSFSSLRQMLIVTLPML